MSSGLAGFVADAREFLAAIRFARPELLWLVLLLPIFGLLERWAIRRRRAAGARLGRPSTIAGQLVSQGGRGWWLRLAYSLGWMLLVLGVAGPRWGKSDERGVAVGRDVVVVIDLSRTMQADDMNVPQRGWRVPSEAEQVAAEKELAAAKAAKPADVADAVKAAARLRFAEEHALGIRAERRNAARWRAAREAALELVDGMAHRGGHRVAVIIFSTRAKVLCPLTTDYDHARAMLTEIDGSYPPPEIRGAAGTTTISGTRIGAALIEATKTHDPTQRGYQDIILLSDGDDPGGDREWASGSDAAREARIPVHTVGLGDQNAGTFLTFQEEPFETRLQEAPLKQIANETKGQYIAARKDVPNLAEFFRSQIEPLPNRELSDESLPLPKERYVWFLAPALSLFMLGWLRGK